MGEDESSPVKQTTYLDKRTICLFQGFGHPLRFHKVPKKTRFGDRAQQSCIASKHRASNKLVTRAGIEPAYNHSSVLPLPRPKPIKRRMMAVDLSDMFSIYYYLLLNASRLFPCGIATCAGIEPA